MHLKYIYCYDSESCMQGGFPISITFFLNIECLHNILSFFSSSLFSDVKRRCLWWWLFCSGGTAVPELVSDLVTVSSYYRSGRAEGMMLATLLLLAATTPRPD